MSIESIVASGRRLMATTLLDRCRIRYRTIVRDSTGGKPETWVEQTKVYRCRWVGLRDEDPANNLDSVFGRAEMILELPLGTKISEGDKVRNLRDNQLWQVVGDLTPPSEISVVMRIPVKQVNA